MPEVVAPIGVDNPPVAPDEETYQAQFKFDGAWLPAMDASEIGPNNFQVMRNLRYAKGANHPEGIAGYTEINTSAITTYVNLKNGHHLRSLVGTTTSYVLTWAEDASGNRRVYYNTTAIPNQGSFEGTHLHTDADGADPGRFATVANNNVVYCNGKENYIWAGDYMPIGACFLCDSTALDNPRDHSERMRNKLSSSGQVMTIAEASPNTIIVLTRRPIKSIHFTVSSANAVTSTLNVHYYKSTGWTAVSNGLDGTASGGAALAQSGTYSFDSTVSDADPFHFEGLFLYAYRVELDDSGAGSATADISHITVNAPWQEVIDIWDGAPREPYQFLVKRSGKYDDRTAHVYEASDMDTPIGAEMDGLLSTDEIVVMFEERQAAIRFEMLGSLVNTTAATMTVKYWDGDTWVDASATDGTSDGTDTLSQTGLISWTPPDLASEFPQTIQGKTGYAYQITVSATLTGTYNDATDSVFVDVCTGIPAPYEMMPYRFASEFKGRTLLCGFTEGDEGNRVDYGPPGYANSFNGPESSMNGIQSLRFGDAEPLTCGVSLYNRYGSSTFEIWLGFKNTKAYQLKGSTPDPESDDRFSIDRISPNIGCPAPLTLTTAELGFEISEEAKRNIALWVSSSGPYAYDGAILYPLEGVENYFDPANSECINWDVIDTARAWYDPVYHEWNLIFAAGTATVPNTWLVLDLKKQRWFEKSTGAAAMPMSGWEVVDSNGAQYIYAGLNNGKMVRLENGTSWAGTAITQKLVTGDSYPSENIWHQTLIRRIKIVAKKIEEAHTVTVLYRKDTDPTDTVGMAWVDSDAFAWYDSDAFAWSESSLLTMSLTLSRPDRLVRKTVNSNYTGWTHAVGFEVSTTTTVKAFQPIGWGIEYQIVRNDY